jgi:uncharacterized protein (DUF2147 family)
VPRRDEFGAESKTNGIARPAAIADQVAADAATGKGNKGRGKGKKGRGKGKALAAGLDGAAAGEVTPSGKTKKEPTSAQKARNSIKKAGDMILEGKGWEEKLATAIET